MQSQCQTPSVLLSSEYVVLTCVKIVYMCVYNMETTVTLFVQLELYMIVNHKSAPTPPVQRQDDTSL